MKRVVTVLVLGSLAVMSAPALAGQKQAQPTALAPPVTTEKMVMDCAFSALLLPALAGIGWLKPATVAFGVTTMAVLHEAIYGCGFGVVGGVVFGAIGDSLAGMLPPMPPPPGMEGQHDAMLPMGGGGLVPAGIPAR